MIDMDEIQELLVLRIEERANLMGVQPTALCITITKPVNELSFDLYANGEYKGELLLGEDVLKSKNPLKIMAVKGYLNMLYGAFTKELNRKHDGCLPENVVVEITIPRLEWKAQYVQKIAYDTTMSLKPDSKHGSYRAALQRVEELKNEPSVEVASLAPVPPSIYLYKRGLRQNGRLVQWSELG